MNEVFNTAESYLGLKEYPGAKHNPAVVKMFADSGHAWVQDDETPWCAAFVGSVLAQCGIKGTSALNARSYLEWGKPVALSEAGIGDVVILWRKGRNSPYGHVAFYAGKRLDKVKLLGGNQGNSVSVTEYPVDRVIGVRRVKQTRKHPAQSKTIQASTVTAVAGAGSGVIAALSKMDPVVQTILAGGGVLAVLMAIWIMRERLRKWKAGDR